MKRVISTLPGGFPLTMDEFQTMQNNTQEITSAIAEGLSFGETTGIIFGIELTITGSGGPSPVADISSGAFWYLDEVYLFDAVVSLALPAGMTEATFGTSFYFDLSQTTNTSVLFNSGLSNDINQIRKAVLTQTPATWVGLNYSASFLLIDNIYDKFPTSTNTVEGKIAIATNAEVQTGTDTTKAVNSASINQTSTTNKGIVELATNAETLAGIETTKAVTPVSLTPGAWIQPAALNSEDTSYFRYRALPGRQVELRGQLYIPSGTNGVTVVMTNLPADYRPKSGIPEVHFTCASANPDLVSKVYLNSNGDLSVTWYDTLGSIYFAHTYSLD